MISIKPLEGLVLVMVGRGPQHLKKTRAIIEGYHRKAAGVLSLHFIGATLHGAIRGTGLGPIDVEDKHETGLSHIKFGCISNYGDQY